MLCFSVVLTTHERAQSGDHFGEVEALGAGARRGATAVALAACELHALSRDALDAALDDYPEHCEQLRAAAAERAAAFDAARARCGGEADNVAEPGRSEQSIQSITAAADAPPPPPELVAPAASGLAEAEAALDALLTWQSAQVTALHRKLCGTCFLTLSPETLTDAMHAQRWRRRKPAWRARWLRWLQRRPSSRSRPLRPLMLTTTWKTRLPLAVAAARARRS